jgi:hypothetical protein
MVAPLLLSKTSFQLLPESRVQFLKTSG